MRPPAARAGDRMTAPVLFLDLATTTGWCEGVPGEKPTSGTMRLAPEGSSTAAVFGGMLDFLATRLTAFRYRLIAYEAPMDPRHMKTNVKTARILLGLPAVVEAVAYQTGHHRLREASVHDVRKFLLGGRPAKGDAKRAVCDRLRVLGYAPKDDNEGDAIAGWLYACAQIDQRIAALSTPLLGLK